VPNNETMLYILLIKRSTLLGLRSESQKPTLNTTQHAPLHVMVEAPVVLALTFVENAVFLILLIRVFENENCIKTIFLKWTEQSMFVNC
jgi:hypothetical protein